jgi:hypothetical protein
MITPKRIPQYHRADLHCICNGDRFPGELVAQQLFDHERQNNDHHKNIA